MKRDTMGEAIALSSPSGRMSKRARKAAIDRLSTALFNAEHDDNCTCKPCQLEKTYLINLICSSVEGEEMIEQSAESQVLEILSSEEAHDWLVHSGSMQRHLSDSEVRIGLPAREPQREIWGVELTEEQFEAYLKGWTLEYLKLPSSAEVLGRLGGLVKSEAKSTSARANGRKGGRPAIKQLDIEDI